MTEMAYDGQGNPIPALKPGVVQTVSISGTSAAISTATAKATKVIRVVSTTNCHYKLGSSPTATTSDSYLPAGVIEYLAVIGGQKIAFIQNAASGTAYVTEMA